MKKIILPLLLLTVLLGICACEKDHSHSFDETVWEHTQQVHYHPAACGCKLRTAEEPHTYADGQCTVCGYEQPVYSHSHSFDLSKWMYTERIHFRNPTCGHMVKGEEGAHIFDESGKCSVCAYQKTVYSGTIYANDLIAWIGYPGMPLEIRTEDCTEALIYTYDDSKLTIDPEKGTVTALEEGEYQVTVTSGAAKAEFKVSCRSVTDAWDRFGEDGALQQAQAYTRRGTDGKTTVFIGDSFFDQRWFWTAFSEDLKGWDALCGGIGGSTAYDWENYVQSEIFLHDIAPKNIVVNIGSNDIYDDLGTAEEVVAGLKRMFTLLHHKSPQTQIYYFSVCYRAGAAYRQNVEQTNEAMKVWCEALDWITFMDVSADITTDKLKDGVHPKPECYASVYLKALENAGCQMEEKTLAEDDQHGIGDSLTGLNMTAGWDLSQRENGTLTSSGGTQEIWFREEASSWYMIEVTISNGKPVNDVWPSAGIIVSDDLNGHGIRIQLFTGYNGNGQHHFKVYNIGRSEPAIAQVNMPSSTGAETAAGCRLKVIRYHTQIWIYVNDVLMYEGVTEELSNEGIAGLYSVGMQAVFSDYCYTPEPELPE